MAATQVLTLAEAEAIATAALAANRTSATNASQTARALVAAEADGQPGHGLSRVPSYALQARCGKVDGFATPALYRAAPAAIRIDARHGFAYPAIELAIAELSGLARSEGIAIAALRHSHHFGVAGAHVEKLATQGLVALLFGNTPQAMPFWGGKRSALGTNPIAFAAPLPGGRAPLVIDMALSVAARGKIVAAQRAGKLIPADWAVDAAGNPTTDPGAALGGSLAPVGGAKGASLALMVEILAAALTASAFGWEASSMFDDKGGPPDVGQTFLAIDPVALSGGAFEARMEVLIAAMAAETQVRHPGSRRLAARARSDSDGLQIPAALVAEIRALASA